MFWWAVIDIMVALSLPKLICFLISTVTTVSATGTQRWHPLSTPYRHALAEMLTHTCNANRYRPEVQVRDPFDPLSGFETLFSYYPRPWPVPIRQYLSDIHYHLRLSGFAGRPIDDGVFVIVAIYMNRLVQRSGLSITYWNVHRILGMSTWIACKM